jgi:DHA1 family multidrug resistance protein-like MFS transporter
LQPEHQVRLVGALQCRWAEWSIQLHQPTHGKWLQQSVEGRQAQAVDQRRLASPRHTDDRHLEVPLGLCGDLVGAHLAQDLDEVGERPGAPADQAHCRQCTGARLAPTPLTTPSSTGSPELAARAGSSWHRNLWALTLASFLMFAAFGFVFPFLPLFIAELGVGDLTQVEVWSGVTAFAQAAVLSIFSPIWGALADRYGRRMMVLRVAFAGGLVTGAMGLSQNIVQFFILRLIQGALTGVIAASTALASSFVPRERLGYAMGLLQMSLFAGNAVGPLLGGIVADHVGYRASFAVTAALMLIAGVVTLMFVREEFVRPPAGEGSPGIGGLLDDIRTRGRDKQLIVMLLVVFSIQFGVNVVLPILPLFVQQLDARDSPATMTGIIYTVAGLVAATCSVFLGRLSDRFGHRRMLILTALGAGLCYIPQAFVQGVVQLIALRGVLGVFDGGLLPAANALISSGTEREGRASHGTTYGLVYLATGLGFGLGPLAGGFIAATLGLRSVFIITAVILLGVAVYLPFGVTERARLATVPAESVSQ